MKITLEVDDPYRLLYILRDRGGQPSCWADQIEPQIKAYVAERDMPCIIRIPSSYRPEHWWNR